MRRLRAWPYTCFICSSSIVQDMSAPVRCKCTLSLEQCELLVKGHVVDLADQVYNNEDQEVVVKHYLGFLCGCAQYTNRLNASTVEKAALHIFGVSTVSARRFSESLSHALAYCYAKGNQATSGKKLSAAVKSVVLSFRDAHSSMLALQTSMKTGGSCSDSLVALEGMKTEGCSSSASGSQLVPLDAAPGDDVPPQETKADDARAIWKIYCLSPPHSSIAKKRMSPDAKGSLSEKVLEVCSSQEVDASQEAAVGLTLVPAAVHTTGTELPKVAHE